MPLSLLTLTLAAFAIGTSEFITTGILSALARGLSVSVPEAGQLVTGYAMGVVVGGPILAVVMARFSRKQALVILLSLFAAGNLGCAFAPSYLALLLGRIATALVHGTFLGIASSAAPSLVAPHRRSQAIATVFLGLTLANVIGVPLGIAIEQAFGWRVTFGAIAFISLIALTALISLFPQMPPVAQNRLADELKGLFELPLMLSLGLSMITSTSLFCLLTYVEPYLQEVTGVAPKAITSFLLVFGLGSTLGSTLGGYFGDRALLKTIMVAICGAGVTQIFFNVAGPHMYGAVLVIFIWGVFSFALVPLLQTLVADHSVRAPTLGSTLNHSAFNLGNALGAIIGGPLLTRTHDYKMLPLAGFSVAALALVVTAIFYKQLHIAPNADARRLTSH